MAHWMDVLQEPGLAETRVQEVHRQKVFLMFLRIDDFAAPSWNRILAMHEMSRMKLRKLIHNIVCESISGRTPSDLCFLEYEALNRPTKARKEAVKEARKQEIPEHRRLQRFLKNGFERPKITERPAELDGCFSVTIQHYRHRRIDLDNLSAKAIIDSLAEIGLIPDDSPDRLVSLQCQQSRVPKTEQERVEIGIMEMPTGVFGAE